MLSDRDEKKVFNKNSEKVTQEVEDDFLTAIHAIMGDDDDARDKFLKEKKDELKYIIRLALILSTSSEIEESVMAFHFLARLSELLQSEEHLNVFLDSTDFMQLVSSELLKRMEKTRDHRKLQYSLVYLSNLSRQEKWADRIWTIFKKEPLLEYMLVNIANEDLFAIHGKFLSALLANLLQVADVRDRMQSNTLTEKLVSCFVLYSEHEDMESQMNMFYAIKNLAFNTQSHATMLSNEDFIVRLVMPIAGPTSEEMDEEDNDQLPLDLQYLPQDKQRTDCVELRKVIMEILLLLCAISESREQLRNKRVYFILRGYHKWEQDKHVAKTLEDVVDILIREENEYDQYKNLHDIEITEDLKEKFKKMDENLLS